MIRADNNTEPSLTGFIVAAIVFVVLLSAFLAAVAPDDASPSVRSMVREMWAELKRRMRPIWLLVILLVLVSSMQVAIGHGDADWIQKGGYISNTGESCCGKHDCFALPPGAVRVTAGGYEIGVASAAAGGELQRLTETIPFGETQKSIDGRFWRCKRPDGTRRCFFAPPPSM